MRRQPVRIVATGVRFVRCDTSLDELQRGWLENESLTLEEVGRLRARFRGHVVFAYTVAFIEFDHGGGVERWEGTPQGPHPLPHEQSATSELLRLARDGEDMIVNLQAELGIGGFAVTRFEFEAAPRRIELDDDLRARLVIS